MQVQKIESDVKFKTSDGKLFKLESEANNHEAVLTAVESHREARRQLQRVLWQKLQTADGESMCNEGWHTYYCVNSYHGLCAPKLTEHAYQIWPELDLGHDGEVTIEFVSWCGGQRGDERKVEKISAKDLYYHRKNAEIKFAVVLREYANKLIDQASKLVEKYE